VKGAPTTSFLFPLLVYYEDELYIEILRKVRSAWGKVVRPENDPRPGIVDERINYCTWVMERVKEVRLPFKPIVDQLTNEGSSQDTETDEMKQLKKKMKEMKEKNAKLMKEL